MLVNGCLASDMRKRCYMSNPLDLISLLLAKSQLPIWAWYNLVLCLTGLAWTLGIGATARDPEPWRAWVGFWLGTAMFYAVGSVFPSITFWIPGLGLYFATFSLLRGYWEPTALPDAHRGRRRAFCLVAVVIAAGADVALVFTGHNSGAHQTVTALAIGMWAWRLRSSDDVKSLALLTYAALQLPIQPILIAMGDNTIDYNGFVRATYGWYASFKLALIPIICFMAKRRVVGEQPLLIRAV